MIDLFYFGSQRRYVGAHVGLVFKSNYTSLGWKILFKTASKRVVAIAISTLQLLIFFYL